MVAQTDQYSTPARLRCGIVLSVQEDACQIILSKGQRSSVRFAAPFPSPRTERVSPGHLVAVAAAQDGLAAVVWRWHDAAVLGEQTGLVRLWEPWHREVLARPRSPHQPHQPGTRAYLSAGLPGAVAMRRRVPKGGRCSRVSADQEEIRTVREAGLAIRGACGCPYDVAVCQFDHRSRSGRELAFSRLR
jgi:hypothetical protein